MSEPVAGSIAGTLLDAKWEMDVLCTHDQDRKEWEEIRSGFNGMTGSVAPILYGAVGYNDLETEYSYRMCEGSTPQTQPVKTDLLSLAQRIPSIPLLGHTQHQYILQEQETPLQVPPLDQLLQEMQQ